ncbi:histidine kinase [Carboxydothermus ferrireducens]|uniref:histidine kinase n=2 Tax=Carboxydothermus TaxID=129957 RepID=A0ABX2R6E5_9THEO|nr:histidine kinase [Carboxydothermus ferrireducens]NYE56529.1 two-component system LytT family sensor kinase [Carboxydothermus ferrireducens DSM 11255]
MEPLLKLFLLAVIMTAFEGFFGFYVFFPEGLKLLLSVILQFLINFLGVYIASYFFRSFRVITLKKEVQDQLNPLMLANEALPIIKQGLNVETAGKIAEIIQRISDMEAVAITDREKVLAYVGVGCERHKIGDPIRTFATKEAIRTGELKIIDHSLKYICSVKDCDCPLQAAVVVPLKIRGQVVGTIKLYQTKKGEMPAQTVKLAMGIAQILNLQMEIAELDRQAQMVTKAQLEALQAKINPHFLFNTLNTIIMFNRTNPELARKLLIHLAKFFRQTLKKQGMFGTLKEELDYVNTYLVLEKARFRQKLRIIRDIDRELLNYQFPVLTLQPLVENAVKHGITPKESQGTVLIRIKRDGEKINVEIKDDGVGISPSMVGRVLEPGFGSGNGVGMSNVHERLLSLYGREAGLKIESKLGVGTTVSFSIPALKVEEEGERENEN